MKGNIYCIYHNKEICYVGSTIQTLRRRWNDYRSHHDKPEQNGYDSKIHRMMRTYGISNFKMELLETVDVTDIENEWINTFRDLGLELYNTNSAYCTSEETRQKHIAYNKEKVPCQICGTLIGRRSMWDHKRTKKCQTHFIKTICLLEQ
jgi:group I intron endonuclease